jgi:hypothetical protein
MGISSSLMNMQKVVLKTEYSLSGRMYNPILDGQQAASDVMCYSVPEGFPFRWL